MKHLPEPECLLFLVILVLCGGSGLYAQKKQDTDPGGPASEKKYKPVDGVAVIVNGEVITWNDVRKEIGNVTKSGFGYPTQEEKEKKLETYAFTMLEKVVKDRLLLQKARAEHITVSKEELDLEVERQQKRAGSPWEFVKLARDSGMTLSQLRQTIKEELLREKFVMARFRSMPWGKHLRKYSIRVSPGEVRDHYRKHRDQYREQASVWLRRVHISTEEQGGETPAIALGNSIVKDLRGGLSPLEVSKKYKESGLDFQKFVCPAEDLEPLARDSGFLKSILSWAFSQDRGAVSDLVRLGPGSFAIFYVEKKKDAVEMTFEAVQDEITSELYLKKQARIRDRMFNQLFQQADISWPELKKWILRVGKRPVLKQEVLQSILSNSM